MTKKSTDKKPFNRNIGYFGKEKPNSQVDRKTLQAKITAWLNDGNVIEKLPDEKTPYFTRPNVPSNSCVFEDVTKM